MTFPLYEDDKKNTPEHYRDMVLPSNIQAMCLNILKDSSRNKAFNRNVIIDALSNAG